MCSNKNIIVRQFTSKFYQRQFSNKNHHQVQHLYIDLYAVTLVDPSATNNTVINFVLVAGVVKTDAKHAYPSHRYPCFFFVFFFFFFSFSLFTPRTVAWAPSSHPSIRARAHTNHSPMKFANRHKCNVEMVPLPFQLSSSFITIRICFFFVSPFEVQHVKGVILHAKAYDPSLYRCVFSHFLTS